ncbi:hypothetical protein BC830DRAFT_1171738 [Chytriomyces sp. MP71]|nr:hypothetical protein BC830DRAFT_1171738 [Chytriomyces sp. MP71]
MRATKSLLPAAILLSLLSICLFLSALQGNSRNKASWSSEGKQVNNLESTSPLSASAYASAQSHTSSRLAIITFASGKDAATVGAITLPNKQEYAEHHGYTFLNLGNRSDLIGNKYALYFIKFKVMLEVLDQGYDWVMWTDVDSVFMNFSVPVLDFADPAFDLILPVAEPSNKLFRKVPNTGHFILKNSDWSRVYLKKMLLLGSLPTCEMFPLVNDWIPACDGIRYWTGEQGIVLWMYQKYGRDMECRTKFVSFHHFNSEWPWYNEGDLTIHLPGRTAEQRLLMFDALLAVTDIATGKMNREDPRFASIIMDNPHHDPAPEVRRKLEQDFEKEAWNHACEKGEGEISMFV